MKLYHYTDKNIKTLRVEKFGNNSFTLADCRASGVKRVFFYLEKKAVEYQLERAKFLYIVQAGRLYDLRADKRELVRKFSKSGAVEIEGLLKYIKRQYRGIIYNTGGLNIACLFYNIKPIKKIERRAI